MQIVPAFISQLKEKESNSGFLNSAKEWASELLNGQTKAGKVKQKSKYFFL